MRNIRAGVSLLLVSLLLFSCVKKQAIKKMEVEPYAGPVTTEILKKHVGLRNVKSIKSLVDIKIYRDAEPISDLNGVLGYESSGFMRVSLFGPFGLTVTDLLLSGNLLQMYIPPKNILYESKMPEFSFDALMNGGFIYSMEDKEDVFVLYAFKPEDNNIELVAKYMFDSTYLLNKSILIYKKGAEILRVDFRDFNGRTPQRAEVSFNNGMTIDVLLQEPEFDADIPDSYFSAFEHGDKKVLPFQEVLKRLEPSR
ncbi:MAG: hypothetical protein AB1632_08430 [Nitrospirota bacterium]